MTDEKTRKQIKRLQKAFDDLTISIAKMSKNSKRDSSARDSERRHSAISRARLSAVGVLEMIGVLESSLPKALPPRHSKALTIVKTGTEE